MEWWVVVVVTIGFCWVYEIPKTITLHMSRAHRGY